MRSIPRTSANNSFCISLSSVFISGKYKFCNISIILFGSLSTPPKCLA
jgi:hypothetical protein